MSNRREFALLGLALLLTACSGGSGEGASNGRSVSVFAAASLTGAFEEIAGDFTAEEGIDVELNFLASSDLAAQIVEGAPADVFASADEASMARVTDEGFAEAPGVFAQNRMAIAVRAGNPRRIESLADLEDPELVVVLCNEACPAGDYARGILDDAAVRLDPDSLEGDVRGVLTRVGLGEADAGIVYATDVAADPAVEGVEISEEHNVVTNYPIAALKGAHRGARAFVDFVQSEPARRILDEHGFQLP